LALHPYASEARAHCRSPFAADSWRGSVQSATAAFALDAAWPQMEHGISVSQLPVRPLRFEVHAGEGQVHAGSQGRVAIWRSDAGNTGRGDRGLAARPERTWFHGINGRSFGRRGR